MNKDTVKGQAEQVAGKVKQKFGEATGNQKIANSGAAEQIKGAARETWGKTRDTAKDVADSQRADAQATGETKAQNLRDKVTNKAQDIKHNISEKLDEVKERHTH
jgi:uncharacterized protein YjbJ (UPF0337 family)